MFTFRFSPCYYSRNTKNQYGKRLMSLNQKTLDKLITEALAIEAEDAQKAGSIGFMARAMVQATMPHKPVEGNEFERVNGNYTLTMLSPSKIGLPYGSMPRLLLAWITTEAVKTKERELILGTSLSDFMRQLDLVPTGGRWGTITRLKEQTKRLFAASIYCNYQTDEQDAGIAYRVADKHNLWWEPKNPEQTALFDSTVKLSEEFFNEVVNKPVPIDMRALRGLMRSPMALDVYTWLTYRMSYLSKQTEIPWAVLQTQFGADYRTTPQGVRDFKKAFLRQLKKVSLYYPEAKVSEGTYGLVLQPSKTHIASKVDRNRLIESA